MYVSLLDATLWVHIAAGVAALLAGAVALATQKGGRWHINTGRIYTLTMGVVVTTAVPLALVDGNYFLFTIAIFSGYLVVAGYRVLSRKRPEPGVAAPIDCGIHLTMVCFGVAMVGFGGYELLSGDGLGAALVAFGGIGLTLAVRELRSIYSPPDRLAWFYSHIAFMGGGYIATVTAVVTVNLEALPPLVRWLAPTAVGVPLIVWTISRYQRRFTTDSTGSAA